MKSTFFLFQKAHSFIDKYIPQKVEVKDDVNAKTALPSNVRIIRICLMSLGFLFN